MARAAGPRFPLRLVLGGLFVLAGILFLLFGWPDAFRSSEIKYENLGDVTPDEHTANSLGGHYKPERLTRFRISHGEAGAVRLDTVFYRNEASEQRTAILFPATEGPGAAEDPLRMEIWREAAAAIGKNAADKAVFISWWDNAQRLDFMTGRAAWVRSPAASAFPEAGQRDFWEQAGGGFDSDETKLKQLARWLTTDAEQALAEMVKALPQGRPVYFLMSLDDLARLGEIEALAGTTLPFEVRIFPQADNIHTQIAAVRQWAGEKGVGSYLVQQLPKGGTRAWRITTEEGTKSLFARLLPFTTSLAKPLDSHSLVYQSRWGAYLSVYQWHP
ncbi:MAG: uncharacterized protein H6R26_1019 [Proteobacteria bacterium]|nr:uncharacterized protein [Pseudomonadota bacterium]